MLLDHLTEPRINSPRLGRIQPEERDAWKKILNDLAASGEFSYGMVYHLVAGRRK
jgi:hypothetical protein